MEPVTTSRISAAAIIGGVECDHLAFRTESVDWQIWISMGDKPYPCRYVVTSKLLALAPEYRVDISDWKTGDAVAADDFSFDPGSATKAELADLQGIDELPDLTAKEAHNDRDETNCGHLARGDRRHGRARARRRTRHSRSCG